MTSKSIINQILATEIPEFLFHYTTSTGLVGIITSSKIRTTKIHYLNDKSELQLAFDYIRDEIEQQKKGIERTRTDEELDTMVSSLDAIEVINVSVASFTENGDQLSQWRGYCDIGNGYSLGFDGPMLQKQVMRYKEYHLVPCVYEEEKHRLMAKELVNLTSVVDVNHSPGYGRLPFGNLSFPDAALFLAPIIKSDSFKEEKEWRLISSPLSYADAEFRSGNYSLIPYWEFDLDLAHTVRKVIIGPTPEPELSEGAVIGLLSKQKLLLIYTTIEYSTQVDIIHSKIPFRRI